MPKGCFGMRASIFTRLVLAGACGFAAAALQPARADDVALGVMDRDRPDYDAKGLPLGGFRLRPALDVGVNGDDNVFRTPTAKESDIHYTIAPSLDLKSDWSRHSIELGAGLTRYQYTKHDSENRTDWNVGAKGRLDVLRGTFVDGATSYQVLHESRYSPDEPNGAARPTEYSDYHAETSITHQPNRLGVSVGAVFDRFDYQQTPIIGGGVFDNHDRDHNQYSAFAKASYEFSPGYAIFMRGVYDQDRYDQEIDNNGFDRNSHAYHADAGVNFLATHLVQGELFGGYVNESFEKPFKNISAFDYGAALHWYVTPLMTFHLTASRAFDATTIFGASTTDDQSFGLAMDYELLRDLIIQTHVNYTDSKFVDIARDDKIVEVAFNLKYLINRYMSANAGYVFSRRNSSVPGQDFTDNGFMATLHLQL
jgi:hypothetical protein